MVIKRIFNRFGLTASALFLCISFNASILDASESHSCIEKNIGDFTYIEVGKNCNITICKGDKYNVSVTVNDSLVPYLHIEQPRKTLKIFMDSKLQSENFKITVAVTMPEIEGIRACGASKVLLKEMSLKRDLEISLKDSSILTGTVTCEDLNLDLSSGSTVDLRGSCEDLSIKGENASVLRLENLTAEDLAIHLTGNSSATVNISGQMAGVLGEGSRLQYTGTPGVRALVTSGGSSVNRLSVTTTPDL